MVMDLSLVADAVTAIASEQGLGFGLANLPLPRQNFISISNLALSDCPADPLASVLQTSAIIVDALAPPPVKPNKHRTARRTLIRKKRRTKRGSSTGGDSDDFGVFGGDEGGSGGEGPFGFGGGGGRWGSGGGGWDFGRFGEQNWDESSSSWWSSCNFAYGFVYEVVYWIALSNCVHFAFKKVARIMADGVGNGELQQRAKVHQMGLTPVY
ncbi:unnamed protein product [Linum trigynum]|uniref:Uncharacterized protein n=1 Tax=Linum trigynum TaxID=586398 RepID=A0AAV2FGA4_9ROSI